MQPTVIYYKQYSGKYLDLRFHEYATLYSDIIVLEKQKFMIRVDQH